MRVSAACDEFYYGMDCRIYCKPVPGLYTCSPYGDRLCEPGRWQACASDLDTLAGRIHVVVAVTFSNHISMLTTLILSPTYIRCRL